MAVPVRSSAPNASNTHHFAMQTLAASANPITYSMLNHTVSLSCKLIKSLNKETNKIQFLEG